MRRLLIGVSAAAVLAVAALWITPSFVPASAIEKRLANFVKGATGLELVIRGDSRFSLFPRIGIEFEQVRIAREGGGTFKPLIQARRMTAGLRLWPLLQRRFVLSDVTFYEPLIDFHIDKNGRENWTFSSTRLPGAGIPRSAARGYVREAEESAHITDNQRLVIAGMALAQPGGRFLGLGIDRVRFAGGTIRYEDETDGRSYTITDADLELRAPELSGPLGVEGVFDFRGKRVSLAAEAQSVERLLSGRGAPLSISFTGEDGYISFAGDLTASGDFKLNGRIEGRTESLSAVLAWLGAAIAPAGIETATISGDLRAELSRIALSNVTLGLSDMSARGALGLLLDASAPTLSGRLEFDRLDLRQFRFDHRAKDKAHLFNHGFITRAIAEPTGREPRAEQAAALPGDFAADLTLAAREIVHKQVRAQDAMVILRLRDRQIDVTLERAALYNGTATGRLGVDGRSPELVVSTTFRLSDVEALPFFEATSSFDWLSGKLSGEITLASGGRSLSTMRKMLRGKAHFRITDGAIEGVDLPHMLSQVQSGDLGGWERTAEAETAFTSLGADWQIDKGLARTANLELRGPLIAADGEGHVDLTKERLDIRLRPRITSGKSRDAGSEVEIPIRIQGKWKDPQILPDLERVLENPEKSVESAKSFGEAVEKLTKGKVKKEDFSRALESLFGRKDEDEDGADTAPADEHKPFDAQKFF